MIEWNEIKKLRRVNRMSDKDIISALKDECVDCSEYGANNGKCHSLYYCANIDAAILIERLQSENTRLKAERDKAIEDLADLENCTTCKHDNTCEYSNSQGCSIAGWQWQGLEGDNGNY